MIYELRIYDAMPGKMRELNERFANHATKYFAKHGMKMIGFWTEDIGTSNRITYILAFEDLADRDKKFTAFRADPDWGKALRESEKNGPLTSKVTSVIMRPTSYSPLQ